MEPCVFCKIVQKEEPAKVVFENDEFLAFSPLKEVSRGHTILIPKKHSQDIFDIEKELLGRLMGVAQKLAADLILKNSAMGINILHASGHSAQQSIFHFHFHIVPRYENDGLEIWFKNNL
jgi:histidine triad (HIT) family protein